MMKPKIEPTIRKAVLRDCKTIYAISKIPALINPSGEPPKLWWIQAFVKEKQMLYVAEYNKEIVGFVMAEELTGKGCMVWMEAVLPAFQGKGIGKQLYATVERDCKKRKIRAIVLYAYVKNKTLSNQLSKSGFERGNRYDEFLKFL